MSVGIPTYDRPAGLRRTLDCIVNQTYRNLEIIVSDNASPGPETEAVVREFQRRDPRIVYHRQPHNIGMHRNIRFVLQEAAGEFFFWAADDDEWTPDFVEVCLANIRTVGSVMTGMRTAVRPLGLLRPNPLVPISAARSPFENAVAFLSVFQPGLFYGIHRTATARRFLADPIFDYFDVHFVLRQILDHGFHVVPKVCYTTGLDSLTAVIKTVRPRPGAAYEYGPFVRSAALLICRSRNLTPAGKLRLLFLLSYWVVNWFAHFEYPHRPVQARLAGWMTRGLRALNPLFRLPLPLPPSRMFLPTDPVGVCYRFIPHDQLDTVDRLRSHLEAALAALRAKEAVCSELRRALNRHRRWLPLRRPASHRPRRQAAHPRAEPADRPQPAGGQGNHGHGDPVGALRYELGVLLLELEAKEAEIQALAHRYSRVRRRLDLPVAALNALTGLARRLAGIGLPPEGKRGSPSELPTPERSRGQD